MSSYNLLTHFQPIFSLKDNKIIGLEALSRGLTPNNDIISPYILFKEAALKNNTLILDRNCRLNALKNYSIITDKYDDDILLFLNVDISIMDKYTIDFGWTSTQVKMFGLKPSNIVLEIIEDKCENTQKLMEFVENYRNQGFLIAIDDFGTDNSNFNRIVEIKPDIIKISGELIQGISKNFVKKSIVKSIVSLSKKIGTVIVAECVESIDDVIKCFEIGIDLFQGFYFAKPQEISNIYEIAHIISEKSKETYKEIEINSLLKKNMINNFNDVITSIVTLIKRHEEFHFDNLLKELKPQLNNVESIYILNNNGIQISSIYCKDCSNVLKRNIIFRYGDINSDHSQKDYFLNTSCHLNSRYITEKYISTITNTLVVTVASKFRNIENKEFILCINFDIAEIESKAYNLFTYEQT
ncbi:EAL domain-containing protein [Deferribacterales bacterium Es71-Z0220]|uniref:EAL domain-containing protein n=1 Tax=Deferrivibrio essentukiensis TaxID=2880922 RepID=UPI001F61E021|nr:EAL domain-containing protein [Deferrivibrio essentukiensis]MCB4205376.1 EAL domain-containing protein [Deferrivibrio essentukiensis]